MKTPLVEPLPATEPGIAVTPAARAVLAAAVFLLASGCASIGDVKLTLQDANVVVGQIADVADGIDDPAEADRLYALEEHIAAACKPLVEGATRTIEGQQLDLAEMLQVSITNPECQRVVNEVRNQLAWLRSVNGRS